MLMDSSHGRARTGAGDEIPNGQRCRADVGSRMRGADDEGEERPVAVASTAKDSADPSAQQLLVEPPH
jgi:hypothetical protein